MIVMMSGDEREPLPVFDPGRERARQRAAWLHEGGGK